MTPRLAAALAGLPLCLVACAPPPPVDVSGHAFRFSAQGGRLAGAEVFVLELPDRRTTTAADGGYRFTGLPGGRDLTFVLRHPDFVETQSATFRLEKQLDQLSFQVPDRKLYAQLSAIVGVTPDPSRCQIASTVTRIGNSLYDKTPGTHGEPGATVTITPPLPADQGPVYFNLVRYDLIFPDRTLTQTTDDGGVLFLDAPPGEYRLRASKPGTTFLEARLTCRPGVLVNPSPPWGLQALTGGVGPRR